MARIRYLKPEFFFDEELAEISTEARLCFQGLWCLADKAGRLEDKPKRIKAQIFPYENVKIEKLLIELEKKPFIQRYMVNHKSYMQIINWSKHQKPHHTEKESTIPEPPEIKCTNYMSTKYDLMSKYTKKEKGDGEGNGEVSLRYDTVNSPLFNGYLTFEKRIVNDWNSLCDKYPVLSKIKEVSDKRRRSLKERFTKKSFQDFGAIIEAIKEQEFLLGKNDRKWKVSFDWIIANDTNYLKILERKYKDESSKLSIYR